MAIDELAATGVELTIIDDEETEADAGTGAMEELNDAAVGFSVRGLSLPPPLPPHPVITIERMNTSNTLIILMTTPNIIVLMDIVVLIDIIVLIDRNAE